VSEPAIWLLVLEWCIRIGLSLRVVMRREPVRTSLAWLAIILLVPFLGAVVYLLVGEKRLGYYRAAWSRRLRCDTEMWRHRIQAFAFTDWQSQRSDPAQLARMVFNSTEIPPLSHNKLELMESAEVIFESMINDIQRARHSCYLEYYIWDVGGLADDVAHALSEAAKRGVDCRILVDAVGSRGFLRSAQAAQLMVDGVRIRAALPANLLRVLFFRFDLRLHRKIAIFDQEAAYVGSQNLADPKCFQHGAGFGQWIDAMVRVEGPSVGALLMTFWEDWQLESVCEAAFNELPSELPVKQAMGSALVQVVPSGPYLHDDAIQQTLINSIYMADESLFLTTPYFVPDEALQTALISAVRRGVSVTIILPAKVNSVLVRLANRALLRELVEVGVRVGHYNDGMLHTKSVVVDNEICMFGSLNLDPRSLHLNFEITLLVYDTEFCKKLSAMQNGYLCQSRVLTSDDLAPGALPTRVLENCARLLEPLL
jgi:cardiolipin synthase A/B